MEEIDYSTCKPHYRSYFSCWFDRVNYYGPEDGADKEGNITPTGLISTILFLICLFAMVCVVIGICVHAKVSTMVEDLLRLPSEQRSDGVVKAGHKMNIGGNKEVQEYRKRLEEESAMERVRIRDGMILERLELEGL